MHYGLVKSFVSVPNCSNLFILLMEILCYQLKKKFIDIFFVYHEEIGTLNILFYFQLLGTIELYVFVLYYRKIIIISGWLLLAFLAYKVSQFDYESASFDPYDILNVPVVSMSIILCTKLFLLNKLSWINF